MSSIFLYIAIAFLSLFIATVKCVEGMPASIAERMLLLGRFCACAVRFACGARVELAPSNATVLSNSVYYHGGPCCGRAEGA